MSKIWAAVSVQCQAFLMKNNFLDSKWYVYVFLVKKHVKPYIFSFSGSWATKWLLWQLPLVSEKIYCPERGVVQLLNHTQ